jgi:hypothetical protein
MPSGLAIIKFDEFEGAKPHFVYPPEFEVDDKYIQQIQISHNFISSIMVHEYGKLNAISYYNEDHGKTIVLFLSKMEDGQDYYEIINQLDQALSKDLPEEQIFENVVRIYRLSFSVFKVREEVLMKLAEECSSLKGIEHDFRKRCERMLTELEDEKINTGEMKIILALMLNEQIKTQALLKLTKIDRAEFYILIKSLEDKKLIKRLKNGLTIINF